MNKDGYIFNKKDVVCIRSGSLIKWDYRILCTCGEYAYMMMSYPVDPSVFKGANVFTEFVHRSSKFTAHFGRDLEIANVLLGFEMVLSGVACAFVWDSETHKALKRMAV